MRGCAGRDMWDKQSIVDDNKNYLVEFPETKDSPLVSIVLVNHNGEGHLRRLFKSLKEAKFYQKYEIVVVEQVSTDGSLAVLEEYKEILPIRVFENQSNESFSVASNKGAALAQGDYLLLLNNDTEVTDGWLDAMLETASQKNAGAVGARLVYPEMPADSINAGKSWTIQHKGVLWSYQYENGRMQYIPYHHGRGTSPIPVERQPQKYSVITAACLLVKTEIFWEVGGLDEVYLWGYEDVDLCLKIHRHGYDNYYCSNALLFHYEFGTQTCDGKGEIIRRRANNRDYLNTRWSGWLDKKILQDRLSKLKIFTEIPLKMAIVVSKGAAVYAVAEKFAEKLKSAGYPAILIDYESENAYKSVADKDIIISLEPKFQPLSVDSINASVLIFAWCKDRMEEWCKNKELDCFNYVLANNDSACDLLYDKTSCLAETFFGTVEEIIDILSARLQQDEKSVCILSPAPDEERGKTWGDQHFAKDLAEAFRQHGYTAEVRTIDQWFLPFAGRFVISLRGSILPRPYHPKMEYVNIMWNYSHPEVLNSNIYNESDVIFVASRSYAEQLKNTVKVPVDILMQCTSLEKFYPTKNGNKHELLFVGDSLGRFRQTVKDLLPTRYEFSLYGRNWEQYLPKEYIKGQYINNEELNSYYGSCDILLNDHWPEMREKGFLSNRLFDGLASGAFLVTDAVEGLEEDLPDGVVAYDGTKEDLKRKIDYWMTHPQKRIDNAEKGRKNVAENHTFYQRARKLIEYMESVHYR